uniref:NADH-ubiquinone oxidoreductase chain 2 n=2 Tax=Microhylidae TaxID=8427 RepID=S4UZW8_9NEOB|nr:NADH dehydrogenase subunit 2 [Cophixalus sp. TNHC 54754]AVP25548.1 NADH dehydrogenase subunit 2 [Hylophorbus sp. TNHC-GDC 31221]
MLSATQLFLISSTILGTLITIMSNHWFLAWVGLEVNTLAFIPLIAMKQHPRAIEAAIKYVLAQATASAVILFSAFTNALAHGEWDILYVSPPMAISLSLALCMKLGLAPFHSWYTDVLQGIPLTMGLLLSTWQKIAPMALLIQISNVTNFTIMILLGVLSIFIGGWGGINQTQLRKILAYSSIAHMGWMIVVLKFSAPLAMLTFITYIMITLALFLNIIVLNMTTLTRFSTAWSKSPALTTTTLLILLSTAGMPPLTGFMPKLLISLELVKTSPLLVSLLFLISLLSLYFYLRMIYTIILTISPLVSPHTTTWRPTQKLPPLTPAVNTLAIMLLPLTPTTLSLIYL